MRAAFLLLSSLMLGSLLLRADDPKPPRLSQDQLAMEAQSLKFQTGDVTLQNGLAKLALKPGWRFVEGPDAEKVLHDFWDNPPAPAPLGMIFPPGMGPMDHDSWAVIVDYEEEGHVDDADAAKTNYSDLLKQMQQSVRDANPTRQQAGYPAMELVGWAEPPHYDPATHKLYWAKDLRLVGAQGSGLNYNVRVLGRKGVLVLNAIADLHDLDRVKTAMPDLMTMVDFKLGNTYAEFNPKIDKVAEYGIAGLVAGTAVAVAAKAGLLAGLGKLLLPVLLIFKKAFIVVIVALVAIYKKVAAAIKGRSSVARPFEHPPESGPDSPTLNAPPPPNRDPLRPPQDPPGGGFPPTKSF